MPVRFGQRDLARLAALARGRAGPVSSSGRSGAMGFAAVPRPPFRAVLPLRARPKGRPRVFVSNAAFSEGFAVRGLRAASPEQAFPIAWGAMRSLTPASTREAERMLRQLLAFEMRRAGIAPFERPVAVALDFAIPGDESLAPVGRRDGDLDNLEKLALDAMNGVVFLDDRLVALKVSRKLFSASPSIDVLVAEIPGEATREAPAELLAGLLGAR